MTERRIIRKIALLVVRDGRLLVVRKKSGPTWILPGGKPEAHEDDETALVREVHEEILCGTIGLTEFGVFRAPAADQPDADVVVVAYTGEIDGIPEASDEIAETAWLDIHSPGLPIAESLSEQILPMLRRTHRNRPSGPLIRPEWKVHLPLLVQETLTNPGTSALRVPYRILQTLLIELANRAMRVGDVPIDEMMIRLALYAQGDPHDPGYAPDAAVPINETRVRELHGANAETDLAIAAAAIEQHDWDGGSGTIRIRDWRTRVEEPTRRAWPSLTFAARVAVVLSAMIQADREERG